MDDRKIQFIRERNEWLEGELRRLRKQINSLRAKEAVGMIIAFLAGVLITAATLSLPY